MGFSHKEIVFCLVIFTTVILFYSRLSAQELEVVNKYRNYCQQVRQDSLQKMVPLKKYVHGLVYDLRYATTNNFMHQQLYNYSKQAFLRLPVANSLQKVQQELNSGGYGLKIFDAYRPYSITKKMWDLIHDDRYVADPSKGSGHNRGLAVDLTIIDMTTGKELDMGTGFDNFTDSAHHSFKNLPLAVLNNRQLLRSTMEKYGFKPLETEWWHYSWPNDRNYTVLDIDFKKLNN
jgi:D-alanyl-D-alanine dipeptidase